MANISLQDIVQGQVDLDIDGFSLNKIKLDSTKLQIKGTEQQHYLILKSKGEPASATLNLQGNLTALYNNGKYFKSSEYSFFNWQFDQ